MVEYDLGLFNPMLGSEYVSEELGAALTSPAGYHIDEYAGIPQIYMRIANAIISNASEG